MDDLVLVSFSYWDHHKVYVFISHFISIFMVMCVNYCGSKYSFSFHTTEIPDHNCNIVPKMVLSITQPLCILWHTFQDTYNKWLMKPTLSKLRGYLN